MTTEELYINFSKSINELEEKLDNKFSKSINELEKRLDNKLETSISKLDEKMDNRFDKVENQVQDLRIDMNENFKKLNNKLDGVTNSNIAQILLNQTKLKNKINKETTYNELEHKKFDCRITELELQGKYLG